VSDKNYVPADISDPDSSSDSDFKYIEDDIGDPGWQYLTLTDDTKIGIHTAIIEEKANACSLLYFYSSELKEYFFPYVEEVCNILVPLFMFRYNEKIKYSAISSMPHLINSVKLYLLKNGENLSQLFSLSKYIIQKLLELLSQDEDLDTLTICLESISECINTIEREWLSKEDLTDIFEKLKNFIIFIIKSRNEYRERALEDYDEDTQQIMMDDLKKEKEMSEELKNLFGTIITYHKKQSLEIIREINLNSLFLQLFQSEENRIIVMKVLEAIFTHSKEEATQLFQQLIPQIIQATQNNTEAYTLPSLINQ